MNTATAEISQTSSQIKSDKNWPLFCHLALFHTKGLGMVSQNKLIQAFGSAPAVIEAESSRLRAAGVKAEIVKALDTFHQNPSSSLVWPLIEKDLNWQAQSNRVILTQNSPDYPALLKHIDMPPTVLFVQGDVSCLAAPQLAMVGSRNPSVDGRDNAWRFASALSKTGLVITSGLAAGIDGAAHEGTLEKSGKTIAVVGTGPDLVYPAKHRALAEAIVAQGGAIVSEFPLGATPQPSHFPRRNRIISGLSLGVLVVEASLRSGSLITAHQALDAGREVYAIPGSIHNPMSRGCHQLLKEGAKLVESVDDIVEELSSLFAFHQSVKHQPVATPALSALSESDVAPLPCAYPALLSAMGYDVVAIDTLVDRTQESAASLSQKLMMMELEGAIRSVAGGYQRCS